MLKIYELKKNSRAFDRYTVIIDGSVFTMSDNPLSPLGVNNYCCSEIDIDKRRLGKRARFKDLPNDVKQAIIQRLINWR